MRSRRVRRSRATRVRRCASRSPPHLGCRNHPAGYALGVTFFRAANPRGMDAHPKDLTSRRSFSSALAEHWPELLIEGALLGLFMISACLFAALLEHPASFVHRSIPSALVR